MAAPIAPPPRPEKRVLMIQLLNMSSCIICSGEGISICLNLVAFAASDEWTGELDDAGELVDDDEDASDLSLI